MKRKTGVVMGMAGSVLLALGVWMGIRYQSDLQADRQRIERLGSQRIDTPCGAIEFAQVGSGEPVLVVHGNGGGFDQGLSFAQGYLGGGFQVIAPSRFGYLRTPLPEGATVARQADAYACLLDALGIDQVAIFATSAGVTSSIQFALRYPERVSALIFLSPNPPGEVGLLPPPKAVFNMLMRSDFAYWALSMYFRPSMQALAGVPKGFPLTPEFQTEVKAVLSSVMPVSQRADGILFDTYISNPEINEYPLDQVQARTLVISAVDDPMALHAGARLLADRIPHARLLAVPDGGHLLLGHTEAVKAEINQFLRSNPTLMKNSQ